MDFYFKIGYNSFFGCLFFNKLFYGIFGRKDNNSMNNKYKYL